MPKGNKGGVTKDDERYGDNSQPKHENSYGYAESADPPSQGNRLNTPDFALKQMPDPGYPSPALSGGGSSVHTRKSTGTALDDYDHSVTHRAPGDD